MFIYIYFSKSVKYPSFGREVFFSIKTNLGSKSVLNFKLRRTTFTTVCFVLLTQNMQCSISELRIRRSFYTFHCMNGQPIHCHNSDTPKHSLRSCYQWVLVRTNHKSSIRFQWQSISSLCL